MKVACLPNVKQVLVCSIARSQIESLNQITLV